MPGIGDKDQICIFPIGPQIFITAKRIVWFGASRECRCLNGSVSMVIMEFFFPIWCLVLLWRDSSQLFFYCSFLRYGIGFTVREKYVFRVLYDGYFRMMVILVSIISSVISGLSYFSSDLAYVI